ncbi:hypothetical protein LZ30DRAFT_699691 [Colletotrichum cereale]|nr:hypothetical protein LZ30DRAFT_699691 [Colletotrichum cereale]
MRDSLFSASPLSVPTTLCRIGSSSPPPLLYLPACLTGRGRADRGRREGGRTGGLAFESTDGTERRTQDPWRQSRKISFKDDLHPFVPSPRNSKSRLHPGLECCPRPRCSAHTPPPPSTSTSISRQRETGTNIDEPHGSNMIGSSILVLRQQSMRYERQVLLGGLSVANIVFAALTCRGEGRGKGYAIDGTGRA